MEEWFADLKKILGSWADELIINLNEMTDKPYKISNYVITSQKTGHTYNSICYRIERNGTEELTIDDLRLTNELNRKSQIANRKSRK